MTEIETFTEEDTGDSEEDLDVVLTEVTEASSIEVSLSSTNNTQVMTGDLDN